MDLIYEAILKIDVEIVQLISSKAEFNTVEL